MTARKVGACCARDGPRRLAYRSRLVWPANITPLHLPPYSPQLNPIERVWLHLRERHLSHRLLDTYDDIQDACCQAWNTLLADTGRIASLGGYP